MSPSALGHQQELKPREWMNSEFNYDNVGNGMLTLLVVSTFEGWPG